MTDAKLITGVINPTNFAGGQFDLDEGKARAAMEKIASGLGTDVVEAAVAVIRTVEANMINALKLVSIQRGHDPRDFALVVGGGGGPMHGAPLGRELGVKEIIVPLYPGLFSAWGMLATEPRRDFMQTVLRRAEEVEAGDVRAVFAGLREEAERYYQTDAHMGEAEIAYEGRIDLRYLGQEHPVTVLVDIESAEVEAILAAFHDAHEKTYTFRLDDTPVEFVTYRLTASAKVPRPEMTRLAADGRSIEAAARPARMADFAEDGRHEAGLRAGPAAPRRRAGRAADRGGGHRHHARASRPDAAGRRLRLPPHHRRLTKSNRDLGLRPRHPGRLLAQRRTEGRRSMPDNASLFERSIPILTTLDIAASLGFFNKLGTRMHSATTTVSGPRRNSLLVQGQVRRREHVLLCPRERRHALRADLAKRIAWARSSTSWGMDELYVWDPSGSRQVTERIRAAGEAPAD